MVRVRRAQSPNPNVLRWGYRQTPGRMFSPLHREGELALHGDHEPLIQADSFAHWFVPFRNSACVAYAKTPLGGLEAVLAAGSVRGRSVQIGVAGGCAI